jgi:hypothetical protein
LLPVIVNAHAHIAQSDQFQNQEFTKVFNGSVTVLSSAGHTNNSAHVHPMAVPAATSQLVAFSTLPATVVLAFTTDHVALVVHAPPI